jgi:CIC family chloride channel protein
VGIASSGPAEEVPTTLRQAGAPAFWLSIALTGVGAGIGAIVLTRLLELVQRWCWPGQGGLVQSASIAPPLRHIAVLVSAGLLTMVGQLLLVRLSSGNGIDIIEAISFRAGKLPKRRTLGSALLSVLLVAMGTSLGREGAPKQVAAVVANALSDRFDLSDERRRLLVACGAGAGMAGAYGVPLGGALFALEVMRGSLSLRMVLPALVASLVAAAVSWLGLPDAATYQIPSFESSTSVLVWSLLVGPIAGVASVGYVRLIALADRDKPTGWKRLVAPVVALGLLGAVSIPLPQVLGNGKDVAQAAFKGELGIGLALVLVALKPAATALCVGSGAPGGLFTPSLSFGAIVGAALGHAWSWWWPGVPLGLFAVIGAAAVLAATTQGPISSVVLMMELTGRDRSFIVPMLLAVSLATLVSRTIEPRSIYDARLTDEQVEARRRPKP